MSFHAFFWTRSQRLLHAVKTGNLSETEELLDSGADIETVANDGASLFELAIAGGHLELSRLLRRRGALDAYWHLKDELLDAASRRDVEGTRSLLERGADPDCTGDNADTPLMLAARGNHPALIKELLAHGARTDSTNVQNDTAYELALRCGSVECFDLLCPTLGVDRVPGALVRRRGARHPRVLNWFDEVRRRVPGK